MAGDFDILIVAQSGRLQYEALLFAQSLRLAAPAYKGRFFVAEPQPGLLWPADPRLPPGFRATLIDLGATILPFESRHFGATYPHGNKIEALAALPRGRPFIFFDTDTLILGDLSTLAPDFTRPTASMRREATWPKPQPGGPGREEIWRALYDRFALDFTASLDPARDGDDWQRYLYFNAGWFLANDPADFGARFTEYALSIRDAPPPELTGQKLYPWLDQIALPLAVHAMGGGRPRKDLSGLDGALTCHWRTLPLLYARESDAAVGMLERIAARNQIKTLLRDWPPARKMIWEGGGLRARALFDRENLPVEEREIRKRLRAEGLWLR